MNKCHLCGSTEKAASKPAAITMFLKKYLTGKMPH